MDNSRSLLRKGAWIETSLATGLVQPRNVAPFSGRGRGLKPLIGGPTSRTRHVAPFSGRGRGLKRPIDAERIVYDVAPFSGRGRGLKHDEQPLVKPTGQVAPFSGRGRGLKPFRLRLVASSCRSLPSPEGGVD